MPLKIIESDKKNLLETFDCGRRSLVAATGRLISSVLFCGCAPNFLDLVLYIGDIFHMNANGIYPDTIFVNGDVVTMNESRPATEAVAVKWDRIVATGSNPDMKALAGPDTEILDLHGRTLIPGFIEPHNHFAYTGICSLLFADIHSPPRGSVENIDDLIEVLRERASRTDSGQWICGRGYDDTLLSEQRHPTRKDLDRVSLETPVWIIHVSGHLSVGNSKALELAGINRCIEQPPGGVVQMDPETGQPNGVLEEKAQSLVAKFIPITKMEQQLEGIALASQQYLRMGVTSTYDAGVGCAGLIAYQKAVSHGILPIRVTMMMAADFILSCDGMGPALLTGFGDSHLKTGPVKIIVDGSIQGYTGWLDKPYHVPFKGNADYRGYPVTKPDHLNAMVLKAHREGMQIACHGNGDAAIGSIIAAYELAQKECPRADARHRIEHCQMAREDQLDKMIELGVSPSFFVSHTFYWGDRHKAIFIGPERAQRISPLKSALERGIRFSIHSDSPVTSVSPLFCMFAAVNRITQKGDILGPEYRLTAKEALKALTVDAAWQNFEDDIKGSIENGKLADFTVLDKNPLKVAPEKIKDIKVISVFIGGIQQTIAH